MNPNSHSIYIYVSMQSTITFILVNQDLESRRHRLYRPVDLVRPKVVPKRSLSHANVVRGINSFPPRPFSPWMPWTMDRMWWWCWCHVRVRLGPFFCGLNSDTTMCSDTVAFKRKGKEEVHSEVGFVCFCLRGVKVEEGWEESPQYGWKFLLFFWWKVPEQNKHRISQNHEFP